MFIRIGPLAPAVVACVLTTSVWTAQIAAAVENTVFAQFTKHVMSQVIRDKQAFAQASTCLSWFYKASKTPPPAVQGIGLKPRAALQPESDCPRQYPGGMEAARDDFAKTQTLLSVSLTVYEFALVADQNDDRAYNSSEVHDLFRSLSLAFESTDTPRASAAILTEQFDRWYRTRNLDDVMKGMSTLYEQGYRVTTADRAELDRVMH
jgi:hypothetical protein